MKILNVFQTVALMLIGWLVIFAVGWFAVGCSTPVAQEPSPAEMQALAELMAAETEEPMPVIELVITPVEPAEIWRQTMMGPCMCWCPVEP